MKGSPSVFCPRRHLRESATPNVIQAAGYPRLAAIFSGVIHCAECRSTKATLTGGRFFSCTSRELVNPSDMWQRSPCMKAPSGQGALRGHYVKQKQSLSWLQWRPQDVGHGRPMSYLQRSTPNREWNQTKRKVYTVDNVVGHGATGAEVCPAEFWSCLDRVFPHDSPIPPLWNGNEYSMPLYVRSM